MNAALRGFAFMLWPGSRPRECRRVCVYRIGNLGDIVCALPAIHAVRRAYPHAHLTLVTSPGGRGREGAAEIAVGVAWIDALRVYYAEDIATVSGRFALLAELRARSFDVWIELPDDLASPWRQLRNMAFAKLAGVRWARGWRVSTLRWAGRAQSRHLRFDDEVDRTLAIVGGAGIDAADGEPLQRSPLARSKVESLLRSRAIARPRVAIAPGATRSTNRWPAARFAAVARRLAQAGCGVVVMGARADSALAREIAARAGGGACSLAGELSIMESCELLRQCDAAVCLDSAAQHFAAAVGTPVVSLFPAWQLRGKWHPHGPRNVVIRKEVPCDTCFREECPHGNRCMHAIEADEVADAVLRLVDRAVRGAAAGEELSCASS